MAELLVSRRAEADLRDIWRYIAVDNPDAADRALLHVDEKLQMYDPRRDEVEIIAVIDGRRELSGLF